MADINSNLPVNDTADGSTGSAVPSIATQVGGTDGTNLRALSTDSTGKLNINNISGTVALPTGAATAANQTNASQKTQVVDGSGNVIASTSNALNVNVTNSFAAGVADKSSFTYGTSIQNAIGGVYQDTSPTLTAGTQGAVRLTAYRAMHFNLRDSSGNEVTIKQLNNQVVATDYGLVTNSVIHGLTTGGGGGYVDVKVTPSGALTIALGDISGVVGQQTMAASLPVAIASDQSAIPVSQSGTWNLNNISGTISLPTGASTSANQTNGSQKTQIVDSANHTIASSQYNSTYALSTYNQDSNQTDNLQRLRVSEGNLLFYASFQNSAQNLNIRSALTGSATVASSPSNSSLRLSCTTSSSDSAIVQSMPYLPFVVGRSAYFNIGANMGAKKSNVRQRLGYFDANDGVFFEQTGTDLAVVTRTSASGSAVDTRVLQASWNLDKLDGTGPSGLTLDTSKFVVYVIDFTIGGRIRYGAFLNGTLIYCHQIATGNVSSLPTSRTFVLPIRVELTNTGAAASGTTFDLMSMSGERESSEVIPSNVQFSASRGISFVNATATAKPLISIRPKTTFDGITNRIPIQVINSSILAGSQNTLVTVVLNGTLTGAAFASVDTNSAVEADITATAISGGTTVAQYYVGANTTLLTVSSGIGTNTMNNIELGLNIAGTTADIISIVVTSLAGGSNTVGTITWEEFQ